VSNRQGKEYKMPVLLIQPWSVPVFKTTLPPDVLQTMIKISDLVIADKEATPWGKELTGQIETELLIENNILYQTGVIDFFSGMIRQFVIACRCQMFPGSIDVVKREEWLTQILTMWIVSQKPGEYNPEHQHLNCQISSVMYLKVPKMLPSRKEHTQSVDGSINFTSNASRDVVFSKSNISISPQVGDFYIFGAEQQHSVYPYRCKEGQEDVERRSISFNAIFSAEEHQLS